MLAWFCKAIPSGRIGEIGEVARLVLFLASKAAEYLNGTLFPIDGGYANTSYIHNIEKWYDIWSYNQQSSLFVFCKNHAAHEVPVSSNMPLPAMEINM